MDDVFVHAHGICESRQIGSGTRIWAFAHVLPGAKIGKNCNICDNVFIENDVVIGDDVTIKCGVQIWDGLRIGDKVFIGPNATFTNDIFPRSKEYPEAFAQTCIGDGASIGANATILPGLKIGAKAMIGAGAVVTKNVPPNAIVTGNPATISGYVNISREKVRSFTAGAPDLQSVTEPVSLQVGGAVLYPLPRFSDMRGELSPIDFGKDLPFNPTRHFLVFNVPGGKVRGEHAHKVCAQFLMVIRGKVSIVLDDGNDTCEVSLDSPSAGVYLPPNVWGIQYKFTHDAILSVYASHPYDPEDYIRSYEEYLSYIPNKDMQG
ncbi:WxcM-like domain-containing protein [Geomonas ferrireducens]|uniref:WxcM-like domain-containing protein n=1 Tax=Geomonas ferrireducens TaxID=2570227 RepID=UPI0010A7F334|nr:WxcM-like domain-containing protein [Geomonas ferrireducens]